jgi:hypothetical protein
MNKRIRKKLGLSKITAEEVWDLDFTLAKYIMPRLIKFKEVNKMSYPASFSSIEEWHSVIDKMIWSFDKVLKDDYTTENYEEEYKKYLEGMNLFADYFGHLWD